MNPLCRRIADYARWPTRLNHGDPSGQIRRICSTGILMQLQPKPVR